MPNSIVLYALRLLMISVIPLNGSQTLFSHKVGEHLHSYSIGQLIMATGVSTKLQTGVYQPLTLDTSTDTDSSLLFTLVAPGKSLEPTPGVTILSDIRRVIKDQLRNALTRVIISKQVNSFLEHPPLTWAATPASVKQTCKASLK
jgi:hypothetical protein